jgi:phosphatidylglycerol:prolipoprotein diacylglycerol transferase
MISYISWDPSRGMFNFNLPILNRPILWYGFFFALGFFAGYLLLTYLLRRYFHYLGKDHIKQRAAKMAEQLTLYVVIGALAGARLGDVLFYQNWAQIARDPFSIIAFWEGGLASHGGAVGILIALWLFSKKTKTPFWTAVDFTVIPTAAAAIFIRIGNFFNQEILGVPTSLPWGVLFLHPADGGPIVPRHPAQLYEAIAYAMVLAALLFYWRCHPPFAKRGRLTGLFLVLVFSLRFLIEFLKMEQSAHLSCSGCLTMGQYLSIPFILLGIWLLSKKVR